VTLFVCYYCCFWCVLCYICFVFCLVSFSVVVGLFGVAFFCLLFFVFASFKASLRRGTVAAHPKRAKVPAANEATGFSRTTQSSDNGEYDFRHPRGPLPGPPLKSQGSRPKKRSHAAGRPSRHAEFHASRSQHHEKVTVQAPPKSPSLSHADQRRNYANADRKPAVNGRGVH